MNEKLIINTSLLRKESCFEPKPCLVEKVVEMPATAFARLISRPLDDQYIIAQNKSLMYCDNEFYHCILAVDMHNGDGLLIESEGSNYARYSQYIPHAREIVAAHKQTMSFSQLKDIVADFVNNSVSESADKEDFSVDLQDLIDSSIMRETLLKCACETLGDCPEIAACSLSGSTIQAAKKSLVETKLYCPLYVVAEPPDYDSDMFEVPASQLAKYADNINKKIKATLTDDDEKLRGLIAWTDDPDLDHKVRSVFPSVENRGGELYGVMTVTSYGELSNAELIFLTDEITGQLSVVAHIHVKNSWESVVCATTSGWGESFEQNEVRLDGCKYFISFWNSDYFYLKPEAEVFHQPTNELKM